MLPCLVKSRLHSRQSSPRSSCVSLISTLDSYSGIPIPSGLLTSFSSNIPTFKPANLPMFFDLSPLLPVVCALFCTPQNLNPLVFMRFRTLCQKPPGVGYPQFFQRGTNATTNRQSRRSNRPLHLSHYHWPPLPSSRFGRAFQPLSPASRRTNPRGIRRSPPRTTPEFRRLPNRSGHQPFPEAPLRTPGPEPYLPAPRFCSGVHQQSAPPYSPRHRRRPRRWNHRPHQTQAHNHPC